MQNNIVGKVGLPSLRLLQIQKRGAGASPPSQPVILRRAATSFDAIGEWGQAHLPNLK